MIIITRTIAKTLATRNQQPKSKNRKAESKNNLQKVAIDENKTCVFNRSIVNVKVFCNYNDIVKVIWRSRSSGG